MFAYFIWIKKKTWLNVRYIPVAVFLKPSHFLTFTNSNGFLLIQTLSHFSLGVSQHMYKITNLWKFELNWSSKLRDNNKWKKKKSCHTKLCAFRCLISRPQFLNLRSPNQIRGKLLLSWKLRHFRVSRFSQCFILPTSPHYSLPSEVLCS